MKARKLEQVHQRQQGPGSFGRITRAVPTSVHISGWNLVERHAFPLPGRHCGDRLIGRGGQDDPLCKCGAVCGHWGTAEPHKLSESPFHTADRVLPLAPNVLVWSLELKCHLGTWQKSMAEAIGYVLCVGSFWSRSERVRVSLVQIV